LVLALVTGMLTSTLALWCCWLGRQARWFDGLVWLLAATLWAIPGPILGVGMLGLFQCLFDLPGGAALKPVLWDQPSLVPNIWVCTLRFFPVALALLWPLLRLLPVELEESAQLDGLGPTRRFVAVIWPKLRAPWAWAAGGVGALTLGELSASKLVATAGVTPLAHHVFQQMHASADTELAALCLLLLATVAGVGSIVALTRRRALSGQG
jgi:ABC-type Fe3+ transport system permease subunit